MAQEDTDLQKMREIIEIMKENDLVEVEIKHGDDKILLKRSTPQTALGGQAAAVPIIAPAIHPLAAAAAPVVPAPSAAKQQDNLKEIKSPLVGTFYSAPSPDSEPFVEIGTHIDSQTVVGIIEAMKVMNEIKAEISGTIAEILVANGQAVEYGQPLFKVKPE
ncbi:acetyl-CoA carboxylase biotin carboxyl carrier protein [bacterium]|nr:MAG: acetyl-CoA carboxylase biotin carboxyl carrier protein [bacterium]